MFRRLASFGGLRYVHVFVTLGEELPESFKLLLGTLRPVLGLLVVVSLLGLVDRRVRKFVSCDHLNAVDRTEMV